MDLILPLQVVASGAKSRNPLAGRHFNVNYHKNTSNVSKQLRVT